MSHWKECRNYENCGCYCIYPDEFEAGLCGNCLEEHNDDERAAELDRLRAELAASREREARMQTPIADDGYAMTFQSLGQYRTALLRALAEGAQG